MVSRSLGRGLWGRELHFFSFYYVFRTFEFLFLEAGVFWYQLKFLKIKKLWEYILPLRKVNKIQYIFILLGHFLSCENLNLTPSKRQSLYHWSYYLMQRLLCLPRSHQRPNPATCLMLCLEFHFLKAPLVLRLLCFSCKLPERTEPTECWLFCGEGGWAPRALQCWLSQKQRHHPCCGWRVLVPAVLLYAILATHIKEATATG